MFTIDALSQWEYLSGYTPDEQSSGSGTESTSPASTASIASSEQPPFTQTEVCLINSIATGNLIPLQEYLEGVDISKKSFPEYVSDVEPKVRQNLQVFLRPPLPENISLQEILISIERARIKILTKDYTGTTDKLCNALVGWIIFHITDPTLLRYAALRSPEKNPGERLERWKHHDDPRIKNFSPDSRPQRFSPHFSASTPPSLPKLPQLALKKGPALLSIPYLISTGVKGDTAERDTVNFSVLCEGDKGALPSPSKVLKVIQDMRISQFSRLSQDHQEQFYTLTPEQIKQDLEYTAIHLALNNGNITNLWNRISNEIKDIEFTTICELNENSEPSAKFFNQNIKRVFQETLSLLGPISQAQPPALENVLTNISVRLEQEWRLCFPHEKKTGFPFAICAIINKDLWTMSEGDCKIIAIVQSNKESTARLLNEETSPLTHAFGAGNAEVSPRAKVTRLPLSPHKPVVLIQGTPYAFERHSPREIIERHGDYASWISLNREIEASEHSDKIGTIMNRIIYDSGRYCFAH